ncbi:MAG: methionine--tRNA ligase, partial [Waterburya sp.]
ESVRLSAYLLSPIVPDLSNKIYQQLGFNWDFNDNSQTQATETFITHSQWGKLSTNKTLGKASPVFSKLELLSED